MSKIFLWADVVSFERELNPNHVVFLLLNVTTEVCGHACVDCVVGMSYTRASTVGKRLGHSVVLLDDQDVVAL